MRLPTASRLTSWRATCLSLFALCSGTALADAPFGVPTFHSLGIYWTPAGGSATRDVLVRYRVDGSSAWGEGLPMRYHPIANTTADKADYRGSVVNLTPRTTYEVELTLEGTATSARFKATTWSESFPIGATVPVGNRSTTLAITQSGRAGSYVLYDGTGATIDVTNQADANVTIQASHVIIRGLTLRGARKHGIHILGGQDIIIENCDISNWGSLNWGGIFGENYQGAIHSTNSAVKQLVVQRCRIHHPRTDANSWAESSCTAANKCGYHPKGPQAIALMNSSGNHVFRYNEAWSDTTHYFNDIFGFGGNDDDSGFPGPDSDIYNNYLANGWDDAIEAEGGGQNVRIWNNYMDNTFMAIGNASVTIGPLYIWRNVSGRSYSPPGSKYGEYAPALKMGFALSETAMRGHMYVFHNTMLQPNEQGYGGLGGSGRIIKHCVTRNNILHARPVSTHSIASRGLIENSDFDYDLFNKTVPTGHEAHGLRGVPTYVSGSGFNASNKTGNFQLARSSPGFDHGFAIPNFSDGFSGRAPDIGAHEAGTPPLQYGVRAVFKGPGAHAAATRSSTPPTSLHVR